MLVVMMFYQPPHNIWVRDILLVVEYDTIICIALLQYFFQFCFFHFIQFSYIALIIKSHYYLYCF